MKKTISTLLKLTGLMIGVSAFAFAANVSENIATIFLESKFIIQSGAVIAALYGGYKVLLEGNATGVHWFMLIIGGAIAGAYTAITGVITGFFAAS